MTYVHVEYLPIASIAADSRCYNDELVLRAEIPYASLFARGLVARMRGDVEFEGGGERE